MENWKEAYKSNIGRLLFGDVGTGKSFFACCIAVSYTHLDVYKRQALTHDKTIIMIAHRLKTVRNADQILVLDNAHIVQRGTHAELIQQKGLYADFVSARQEAIGWKLAQ